MDFSREKNGYNIKEVDNYISNMKQKYEQTTGEQKIRISDLKRELESTKQELSVYKDKNSDISNALVVAVETAKQIENSSNGCDIKIFYPTGLKPTRKNVLDKKAVGIYSGGVNYFPFYPVNKNVAAIDTLLQPFTDDVYTVSLKMLVKIMEQLDSETADDWNVRAFIGFINTLLATDPAGQGKLIVRRNRDIGKGTGTLLSPADRNLGDAYPDNLVLTMYKITGNRDKGWDGIQIWIPNIKLPGDCAYYTGETG